MRKVVALCLIAITAAACGDNGDNQDARPGGDGARPPDARIDADTTPDADLTPDADTSMVSAQIQAALDAADGAVDLPITNAIVTYLKPAIGNDPAGFTIQGAMTGPALFVAVDPATLTPAPAVGDVVSFRITEMATAGALRQATMIADFARSGTGADVNALVQDLTAATDVVTALDSYASEVIDVSGTIASAFVFAGSGFEQAPIDTTGITGDAAYRIRIPTTIIEALDIVPTCDFVLNNVPVGRFNANVQLPAYVAADITLSNCPAPTVVSAVAASSTTVVVTFDRNVAPGSVSADGSQFTFDNGLTASAAAVDGRTVTVTTGAQTGGTLYTVTVANTITDLQGTGLGTPNTATFSGFQTPAVVRINELNANIGSGCDLIELRVVSGGSMAGFLLRERNNQDLVTFPAGFTVATNDIVVVHMNGPSATCNPGGATQETAATNEQPAATFSGNYNSAFDFWSTDTGLTSTDNVFTLYNATGDILDAVFVADAATGTAAADSETQAAVVAAAMQWEMVGGGVPSGGFVDDAFRMWAALDLNGTGTTATGNSIQRLDNSDDDDKDDWNDVDTTIQAETFGLINLGQTAF